MTLTVEEANTANQIMNELGKLDPIYGIQYKIDKCIDIVRSLPNYKTYDKIRLRFLFIESVGRYILKFNTSIYKLYLSELEYAMDSQTMTFKNDINKIKLRILPHTWDKRWLGPELHLPFRDRDFQF